ncbi:tRNA-splicing endonuclease [Phytophthora citrophthora]|uniref:tRNA-intron lyase n=1 Tax=Phytophthora citrophthora TaxID=4793 RepID=A0AAD9GW00_9STRA|nr:tRNA-splicing endonuclease [Phytophthora citrophthora]
METVVALCPEDTYALVDDAEQVSFLQQECRIYGSPEGVSATAAAAPSRLRLALEEMAVGVAKGFLRLNVAGEEGQIFAKEIARELTDNWKSKDVHDGATWRLTQQRCDRLRVFRDLWDRGYIVTFGSKFGADFLLYKDNPRISHAVALVVVKGYEEDFARVDVVSFCRVAKMVKKQLIFASVRMNEESTNEGEQKGESSNSGAQEGAESVVYVSLTHALLVSRQEQSE